MQCPQCQFVNREGAKFCIECGKKLELKCPQCSKDLPLSAKFCDECGHRFGAPASLLEGKQFTEPDGERKYVTVLFSDLSGYTAMSEKLDPEEVKEITTRIFGQAARIIDAYAGFVEKYAGDAVMALFGVPKAHEDDPVRAIRAAREIHQMVEEISPELENRIGRSLAMHSGINTGLVVTGEIDLEKGTHGVAGDTVNLAARLGSLARPGEIILGSATFRQAEGYFDFEELAPASLKGKAEPIKAYRLVSAKEAPVTLHRLSGLKARLIGRKAELEELREAVEQLKAGQGRIFSICGEAGTGKSRLVQEFKESLESFDIQWLEAHAYAYTQNVPYYPLVDLFNRSFAIEENDRPQRIKEKIETSLTELIGDRGNLVPYVGSLYSLDYPEIKEVSPEYWKARLQEAVKGILTALAEKKPTVFFLEDLHWADPSFGDLLRSTLQEVRSPAVVLCVYRPGFSLFLSHQLESFKHFYREIRLQDLSSSEVLDMLESLLQTDQVPSDLSRFVRDKAEGNPFYLEELINSLIESNILTKTNGTWRLIGQITESNISSTVHGIVSGRLDRLEKKTKRVLQEASVIGRSFLYQILNEISELKEKSAGCLLGLERLDLIRTKSLQPDLEYIFKHALTQEVVYNGLLKRKRRDIHERIGSVMEQLFQDRLPEYYETLAYHFSRGQNTLRAIDYLVKSAAKSLTRYAVEESHRYYQEAYKLLAAKSDKTEEEKERLIDLVIEWAYVFYYRGNFQGMAEIFESNQSLAVSLDNKGKLGMYYSWLGWALCNQNKLNDGQPWLEKALELGKETKDQLVIGYACTWLTWAYCFLGQPEDAILYGKRAQKISKTHESDAYLYFKSLAGLAFAYGICGKTRLVTEVGQALVDYGKKHSNIRSLTMGHAVLGMGQNIKGYSELSISTGEKAIQIAAEPYYAEFIRLNLGLFYLADGQLDEAENAFQRVVVFSQNLGAGVAGVPAEVFLGAIMIAKGQISRGLKHLYEGKQKLMASGNKFYSLQCEYLLGNIFLQIVMGGRINLSQIVRNIGFVVKNVPFAATKAEAHFQKVIEAAKEIGANVLLGKAYFDLGRLHMAKSRTHLAKECLAEAVHIFEQSEADIFIKDAKDTLDSL